MSIIDKKHYDISKKAQHGAEEMEFYGSGLNEGNFALKTVTQIVNEIVDKAMSVSTKNGADEKINIQIVNNILQDIYAKRSHSSDNETILLDEEIKKIINEMKYPPPGDQIAEPPKTVTIKKKAALTNLVRNSKQFLSKFILNESTKKTDVNGDKAEADEKLVKVIELDCISQSDTPYVVPKRTQAKTKFDIPSNIRLQLMNMQSSSTKGESSEESSATNQEEKKGKTGSFITKFMNYFRRNKNRQLESIKESKKKESLKESVQNTHKESQEAKEKVIEEMTSSKTN